MKQTVLPARLWYDTGKGWASREKAREDYADDRALIALLGIGEQGRLDGFAGITPAVEKAADAMLALNQFESSGVRA